jgi:glycerol kinase
MAGEWILAIDQGTTNTKALLVDRKGEIVHRVSAPVEILQPQAGWVEQDPLAREHGSIAGIAIANQRETAVLWRPASGGAGSAGEPIGNAITWQCRRSAPMCEKLRSDAAAIQATTGLPLDPLVTATKWAWALEQKPELRAKTERGEVLLGTVDSWLLFNLTAGKVHATDHTNASRTALMSLAELDWDEEMLDLFQIPRPGLPGVRPSTGDFGSCVAIPELAGIPIVAIIGDSHAALVGHGCYESGTVKATYGTGSSLMMLTSSLVSDSLNLARSVAWSTLDGVRFALEGNIAMSGATLQWVGEFLGLKNPSEGAAALAETVPDAAGLVLVPAMVGLGAPHWDATARGLMCNLERSHTAAHLGRAAVDAIAHQVADVLEAMEDAAKVSLPVLLADGGATRNDALMQMQADLIGRPVHRSTQEDLSARGAALLGGLALGWWRGLEELSALPNRAKIFEPRISGTEREKLRDAWRLAVQRTLLKVETVA